MYRRVALEYIDDQVRAAIAAVKSARAAEVRLDEIRRQIGELVLRMRTLEQAEAEATRALAQSQGGHLTSNSEPVPGQLGSQHHGEWAALWRTRLLREEVATALLALKREACTVEAQAPTVPQAKRLFDQALVQKERWLCEHDEELRLWFAKFEAERARLARLIVEIDRALLTQRTHDPPPLQPFHVQLLRERRRDAQQRVQKLEREHQAILLDGVDTAAKQ